MRLAKQEILTLLLALLLPIFDLWAQPCTPVVNLGNTISFCSGNSITLNAYWPNSTYLWNTGATSPTITVTGTGLYSVAVTNSCGTTIDSVQVYTSTPLNVSLGADRNVCSSNTNTLSVPFQSGTNYSWSTGSISNTINVSQTGTYHVTATNACGTFSDTVTITVENPPVVNLGPDVLECNNPTYTLYSGNTLGNRAWSDGSSLDSLVVSTPGNYWVQITNSCGTTADTVNVNFLTNFNLLPDTIAICQGNPQTLSTSIAGTYLWNTGSTNSSISVSNPGTYWVQVQASCGTLSDTVEIVYVPQPVMNIGADTTICANQTINLSNNTAFAGTYLWSTGSTGQSISVNNTGTYWLRIDNGCQFFYDSINVTVTPIPYNTFNDTIRFCSGSPVLIDPGYYGPTSQYTWNNGATSQTQSLNVQGNYWVYVSTACGADTFNFYLLQDNNRNVSLNQDSITTCASQVQLNLNGAYTTDSIVWSTGASQVTSITVNSTGWYYAYVYNNCGIFIDSTHVTRLYGPDGISADTLDICSNGGSVVISVPSRAQTNYLWSTGANSRTITVNSPGSYSVIVSNICDTIYDTVYVKGINPISINLGVNQTICFGDSAIVDASPFIAEADSIRWSDGSTESLRYFTIGGTYILNAYNACGQFSDTVIVTRILPPQEVLFDTAVCAGNNVTLNASQANISAYFWSTGASTSSINVTSPGWYYVTLINQCGILTDSVYVEVNVPIPTINLGNDTIFCAGTITLDAGYHAGAYYYWQNGATTQSITVSQSGTYYVSVQNGCGSQTDTINVLVTGPPFIVLGNYVAYCSSNTLSLNAQNPGSSYLWNTGDTTQSITVTNPGLYWVDITNECGSVSDTVEAIVESPPNNYTLGNDTTICQGDTLVLTTGYPDMATLWQDSSRDFRLDVTQTGLYWAKISNSCGDFYDSIYVTVRNQAPIFNLGNDTAFCYTDSSFALNGPTDWESYSWNTGATTPNIVVDASGLYVLTTTDFCGYTYSDSITIEAHYPQDINLGNDTILCAGELKVLNSGVLSHETIWEDGSTGAQRIVSEAGIYIASANNACGTYADTIIVDYHPEPVFENEEIPLCDDDSLELDILDFIDDSDFDFSNYNIYWSDNYNGLNRTVDSTSTLTLNFENLCNVYSKTYSIETELCECPLFIPNAFTPNNDLTNETFTIGGACEMLKFHLTIRNRWGQLVFESYDRANEWDGTFKGTDVPTGIYVFFLEYSFTELDRVHDRETTGVINVLR